MAGNSIVAKASEMNRGVSTYLDLIRIVAALEVFIHHFTRQEFARTFPFFSYGHQSVIVFFVLSGYVIAYVSVTRETDLLSFVSSRATRLYSVVVPALIVTAAIDIFLMSKSSIPLAHDYQLSQPWKYVPLFLAFGTDWWFLDETAFSNIPYWSLGYEAWYYALFASCVYFRGRKRLVLCGAVLLLVGPRSWLLLPIWVSGVALYRFSPNWLWPRVMARAVWGISLVVTALFLATGMYSAPTDALYNIIGQDVRQWLRFSQFFLGDYILTIFILIHFAAARSCNFEFGYWQRPIRYVAGLTFTLYLFHYPLLTFYAHWLAPVPLAITVLISIWGLSVGTDRLRRNMRPLLSAAFALREMRVRIADQPRAADG